MTALQALRIYGPCTVETLTEALNKLRPDYAQLSDAAVDLELWALESHDQAYPSAGPPTTWDLTPIGRKQFTRDIKRAKDEARLCRGVRVA